MFMRLIVFAALCTTITDNDSSAELSVSSLWKGVAFEARNNLQKLQEERLVIIRDYISSHFQNVHFTEPSDDRLTYVLAFTSVSVEATHHITYTLNIPRALFDDNIPISQLETLLNRQHIAEHLRQHKAYSLEYPTFDAEPGP
jgi:hypothetical protein